MKINDLLKKLYLNTSKKPDELNGDFFDSFDLYMGKDLIFETVEEADQQIHEALESIKDEPDFTSVEFAVYACLAMGYYAQRRFNKLKRIDIGCLSQKYDRREKEYLEYMSRYVFSEADYAFHLLSFKELDRKKYENMLERFLHNMHISYPDGVIGNKLFQIKKLEQFLTGETEQFETEEFDKNILVPVTEYLPHVKISFDCLFDAVEEIRIKRPSTEASDFVILYEEWVAESLKTMLKIPYKINTEKSVEETMVRFIS